jgi:hypothetical protein
MGALGEYVNEAVGPGGLAIWPFVLAARIIRIRNIAIAPAASSRCLTVSPFSSCSINYRLKTI